MGASDSSIFQCDVNWFQDAGPGGHRGYDSRSSHHDQHVRSFRSKRYEDSRNQPTSTSGDTRNSVPFVERSKDNSQKSLARPLQYPSNQSRMHSVKESTTHLGRDLLAPFFSPYGPRITSHRIRQSTTELLPPISLLPKVCSPDIPEQRPSSECSLMQHAPFSASSLRVHNRQSHPNISYQDTPEAFGSAPPWHQQSSCCIRKPSGQRSLHKTLGSRKLRREAEWGMLGTQQAVQINGKAQAHCITHSPNHGGIPSEHPVTPPPKSRVWIEASSSEESVEQAVTAPKICTRGMQCLHHLSVSQL